MVRPTYTRDRVAAGILAGENLVILHNTVLKIPPVWLEKHPGGALSILHFVGRDATDEIEAYHSDIAMRLVKRYAVANIDIPEEGWEPFLPPIMSGWVRKMGKGGTPEWYSEANVERSSQNTAEEPSSQVLVVERCDTSAKAPTLDTITPPPSPLSLAEQTRISKAYRALHQKIMEADLYNTRYIDGYGPEFARYTLLGATAAYLYYKGWLMTSAVFLGLFWHQLVFICHDGGHMGISGDWTWDRLLCISIADFIGGLSIGWWVDNHNVHHLVPNHPSHDPDIQHLPFFAISPVFFKSLWSSYYKRTLYFDRFADIVITVQHKLFYIVMAFARFNLYANSYGFLFKKAFDTRRTRGGRWAFGLEVTGILCFWYWFSKVLIGCGSWQKALAYLLISHAVTSPLHVQIVLSHFSMSTADLGPIESFAHRQLRTTSDVICPESLAFIHGGLHLQVTHHLFPRLPRHNLKKASYMVKEFAAAHGIKYHEFGFIAGNKDVLGVLRNVADQVGVIGMVAKAEAEEAIEKKIQKH